MVMNNSDIRGAKQPMHADESFLMVTLTQQLVKTEHAVFFFFLPFSSERAQ
jgi:hypothetical protein